MNIDRLRPPQGCDVHEVGGHMIATKAHENPVLFLDIDGVLARENGGSVDFDTMCLLTNLVHHTDCFIVWCSDRVRRLEWNQNSSWQGSNVGASPASATQTQISDRCRASPRPARRHRPR